MKLSYGLQCAQFAKNNTNFLNPTQTYMIQFWYTIFFCLIIFIELHSWLSIPLAWIFLESQIKNENGLCFYHIYIGYILVETRCQGIQTQCCCSVGHFARGALIHNCFVQKSMVATTSLWSCSKKEKFANWTNLTMAKTNCHHLHHVVSWVWKLLINIKIPVRSLHYQHQEVLKLCHKINQDKHAHKS